ncbi:aKG-HExxH-type peptide beta-hydroxylase [Streptomyces sp. LN549]|uniref:aKG-HExxH-type peptide beta-hydroxylase n=1 Tax=Streptomyces sp. LN549 TaxID=3112979 RepID=UPI00372309CF
MTPSVDTGGHLAVVTGADEAAGHYASRLRASVTPVTRRLAALAGPGTERELGEWRDRFNSLDDEAADDVVGSPFFTYYWLQLLDACVRGDRAFVAAWSRDLGRFLLVPHLRRNSGSRTLLRLPAPANEIHLPGLAAHFTTTEPVDAVSAGPDGDGSCRDGILRLPEEYLMGEGADVLGCVRRVRHHVITDSRIEVSAADPWIRRHLASMNSKPPMEGYPAPDLQPLDADAAQLTDIDAAYGLIKTVWPGLMPELDSYVRLFVPYSSAFHSSFAEACLMRAVFLSEAKHPFSSTVYTAEHLLHEAAHLRLTLIEELDPLVTGAIDTAFASPVRKDPRPLSAMLQTVFAFARIAAFHRHAIKAGRNTEHGARHAESVGLLHKALLEVESDTSLNFTAAGQRLWSDMWAEVEHA